MKIELSKTNIELLDNLKKELISYNLKDFEKATYDNLLTLLHLGFSERNLFEDLVSLHTLKALPNRKEFELGKGDLEIINKQINQIIFKRKRE